MKRSVLALYLAIFIVPLIIAFFVPINTLDKGYLGEAKPILSLKNFNSKDRLYCVFVLAAFLISSALFPYLLYILRLDQTLSWLFALGVTTALLLTTPLILISIVFHETNFISQYQIYKTNIWGYGLGVWCVSTFGVSLYLLARKVLS